LRVASGVDAAKDCEHHHILQLLVAKRALVPVGFDEVADEIASRRLLALPDEASGVVEHLIRRTVYRLLVGMIGDTECKTHSACNRCKVPPIVVRKIQECADDAGRIWLGAFGHEFTTAPFGEDIDQLMSDCLEPRLECRDELGREGRVGQPA